MIITLITIAGGIAIVYNVVKSKFGKLTSKGRMLKNTLHTFLSCALILIGGYLLIHFFIIGG